MLRKLVKIFDKSCLPDKCFYAAQYLGKDPGGYFFDKTGVVTVNWRRGYIPYDNQLSIEADTCLYKEFAVAQANFENLIDEIPAGITL